MKKEKISWNYVKDPNEINKAIIEGDEDCFEGLHSASQIISISWDSHQSCYVVFWRVEYN